MIEKRQILVFIQNKLGGAATLLNNITNSLKAEFIIKTVYIKADDWKHENASDNLTNRDISFFSYSQYEKRQYLYTKLSKHINSNNEVIIANDGLELDMYNYLKLKNPLAYILHGDYELYYKTAVNNSGIIDKFIAVSENIQRNLSIILPERVTDIHYLTQVIPDRNDHRIHDFTKPLELLFIGRMTEEKGFFDLSIIDMKLKSAGIRVNWKIVGYSIDYDRITQKWLQQDNVKWMHTMPNQELQKQILLSDVFILPSRAEGFPLTLLETMKAGLVPLISDLPGAIDEVIKEGVNGFKIPIADTDVFTERITFLNNHRLKLQEMSVQASIISNNKFNCYDSIEAYRKLLTTINPKNKLYNSLPNKSILEYKYLPALITKNLRRIRHFWK